MDVGPAMLARPVVCPMCLGLAYNLGAILTLAPAILAPELS